MGNINWYTHSIRRASRSKVSLAISCALLLTTNVAQAEDFIPQLKAHGKPSPFAVMPLYDLNQPGGEMPYVQPQAEPTQGAIDTVVNSSSRTALVGTSYNSATGGHETFADVRKKGTKFYGRAIIVDESASEYDGESGEEIRFGYDRQAGQIVLGTTPRSSTDVKLVYIRDIIEDNKNPIATGVGYYGGALKVAGGYGVDPIDTDRQVAKLMWDENVNGSIVQDFHLEFSSISLDRTADNYSLRDTPVAQQQKAKVDRTVNGFKADSDLMVLGSKVNLALDYSDISHDAKRYGGPNTAGLDYVSAYHYPGVEMDEWLLSAVSEFDVATAQTVTFGVNYKYVDATATNATRATNTPGAGNMSALQLYQTYYGDVDLDQSEGNFSAKLQWDYDNASGLTGYASVANFFRSPDTQERYFAVTSFAGVQDQPVGTSARAVGNPDIEWEQHRRIEAGIGKSSENWVNYGRTRGHGMAWDIDATVYYDDINDFITRDRARAQAGISVSDYARIWRNVDATMSAIEIDAKANLTRKFATRLVLNFTDGENTTDDRDLYYVSPFEGNLFFDYSDYLSTGGTWNVGTQIRYVAEQNSVDADPTTGSGYDGGEADSFTTVGLYASAQFKDRYGIKVGVDNLTNESYTDSMAKFSLEGNRVLVEAPERSFYVAIAANF
ncbi:TonB-dependent receptor [Vibrio sp. DW001]|uniref:TonB-dependent receptor domain-containing protein n=1 Tax=Vibrio sp. DW001 TaxID=2912315 RepID=UPI0023AF3238|nr:TonB-dependent receptor [Vibrio sp. DW001]WED25772.1 TonB-dependent receptor [Vibrio sp. DW001]